jgi:hypothetical protein
MFKITPNPPETDSTSPHPSRKNKKHDETTKRVLDHYLLPEPEKSEDASKPGQLFTVASADAMISNLAFDLEGPRRHIALGIQQLIEMSSLLASRALDNVDPR